MSNFQSYKYKKISKHKNKKKIILNTAQDLLKIPEDEFEKINISNLSGVYYDQIYQKALKIEETNLKVKNKIIAKSKDSKIKSPKKNINNINKTKESPVKNTSRNNFKEKAQKEKSRSKSKEKNRILKKHDYSIFATNFSVDLRNSKHLFSPEMPPKMNNPFTNNEIKNPKTLRNNDNNKNKNNNMNNKNINNNMKNNELDNNDDEQFETSNSLYGNKKLGANLIRTFDQIGNNERKRIYISMLKKAYLNGNNPEYNHNYNKNDNDESNHKKKSNQNNRTENNNSNINNNINNNNNKKDNIKDNKNNNINDNMNNIENNNKKYNSNNKKNNNKNDKINNNSEFKINKIIFYIRYDSNYGDNIGILGSTEKLGNWSQDKILYLKWNKGNIWTGEIDVDDSFFANFEFKFINRHDGIIYWEKGLNNVVNLNELVQLLKYQKKGRFNKYEYKYDINNFTLVLTCKIKGWE